MDASFRWRIWKGLEKELRKEMKKRGELNEIDQRPVGPEPAEASRSAYSVSSFQGQSCTLLRRVAASRGHMPSVPAQVGKAQDAMSKRRSIVQSQLLRDVLQAVSLAIPKTAPSFLPAISVPSFYDCLVVSRVALPER